MKIGRILLTISTALCILLAVSCGGKKDKDTAAAETSVKGIIPGSVFMIYIIMDTVDDWSIPLRDGFIETLDEHLSSKQAAAEYKIFDTKLDPVAAAGILTEIEKEKPDLICTLNYPSAFADINITRKLKGSEYRFISENAIAVESGTIASWERPGGNVTGAGVFLPINSTLRLIKKALPQVRRIFSYSWDQMVMINSWWENELIRACSEEGFILEEFRLIKTSEEEMELLTSPLASRSDIAITACISAYVDRAGNLVDMTTLIKPILTGQVKCAFLSYEDSAVALGALMGACVIWKDLGAQLADKAVRVLQGENPGEIPWDYPRKYNIVLNMKTAERIGVEFPQDLLNAAYRIYTDYDGSFMGASD